MVHVSDSDIATLRLLWAGFVLWVLFPRSAFDLRIMPDGRLLVSSIHQPD
jgi:hypothetical protein